MQGAQGTNGAQMRPNESESDMRNFLEEKSLEVDSSNGAQYNKHLMDESLTDSIFKRGEDQPAYTKKERTRNQDNMADRDFLLQNPQCQLYQGAPQPSMITENLHSHRMRS